jgi:S-adenosylmethionine:tRNA ribosyltransferase-isomerase
MFNVDDYNYVLPEELIAEFPKENRDSSRMLVLDRSSKEFDIKQFKSIVDYFNPNDCIVINNTKVLKARLLGLKEGNGAKIEAMLIAPSKDSEKKWNCFIKPGKRVRSGTRVLLQSSSISDNSAEEWYTVLEHKQDGSYMIELDSDNVDSVFDKYGNIPLPPYIKRKAEKSDETRYQTVYSKKPGAVAAPTAGLHFTTEILEKIQSKGVKKAEVTLHVGAGTFQPVSVANIKDHKMHSEEFFLSDEAAELINETKRNGGRVFAVGTTSIRVLETVAQDNGEVKPGYGWTDIFIHPPQRPKVVDCVLTNFHLPKSTLIMLISTFTSKEKIFEAYRYAIENKMRFYSYGDCMLIV